MKAIRIHQFGDPQVMQLEEVHDPAAGSGELVVRLHAIGVNPVDTYIRAGVYGPRQFPFVPGMDGAGLVVAVGDAARSFKRGDRVYIAGSVSGAYAQLAVCREFQVHPLPAHVSFSQGAAMGVPYGTAFRAMFCRGAARPGETLLVHGATGGVGTAAVQLARAAGLLVIGTGGTDRGRQLVIEQGAHHVLDHHAPDYLKQLLDLTGGRGIDLILEMLANVNLGKDLTVLAKNGRVVVIGSRGPVQIDPRETMGRNADIRGMTLMNADEHELYGIHMALVAGLENRTLRPVIGREMPLAQAPAAHVAVMESGSFGKVVLIP